ncbi:MAG: DUF3570 domain-containing protein [Polyangiales bacterium]
MQLRVSSARILLSVLAMVGVAGTPSATPIRADETTGTWTGQASIFGNYYYEKSTRVIAPQGSVELESPKGVRLRTKYLVDSITSASIAAGTLEDRRFREVRHDVTVGSGKEFDLGERQIDVDGNARVSREPDYTSFSSWLTTALSLNNRQTVLRTRVSVLHDEVRQVFRGGVGIRPTNSGGNTSQSFAEHFNSVGLGAAWEQVLNRNWFVQTGYDYTWLHGYLSNPYRTVSGGQRPENHPSTRHRHNLWFRSAWYIPKSKSAIHLLNRTYFDSWSIKAVDPEVRFYQDVHRLLQLRLRYRFYIQGPSFFYNANPNGYTDADVFVTADPKMSAFRSHLVGLNLKLSTAFFAKPSLIG